MTTPALKPLTGTGTGTSTGDVKDYKVVPMGTRALSMEVGEIRTETDLHGGRAHDLHDRLRAATLDQWTLNKSRHDVPTLLDELAYQRGMAWTHIAQVADVSVSAVRKWRKGNDASPESRSRLAKFAALLDMLEGEAGIEDPATWTEMELPLAAGHYIRPLDLYLDGKDMALLDIAEQRGNVEHILDEIRPDWRASRSKFEVFEDTDGMRSIRLRGE
jgi:transcriptional regulator with XRE-family HTH domain